MWTYGGGTLINSNTTGYTFFLNYFSDLGRTQSFGNPNTVSAILFFITLMFSSFAFAAYFIAIPGILDNNLKEIKIISILGILNAALFGCIALTPANLFPVIHDLIVFITFVLSFIVSCLLYSLFKNRLATPRFYYLIFLVFSCLIAFYGLVTLITTLFPEEYTDISLLLRVIMQKIVIYYLIASFFIHGLGALKNYPIVVIFGKTG